jgi:hypothetical protein
MPWRICSDFDKPVRAEILCNRSNTSDSIMKLQSFFLATATHIRITRPNSPVIGRLPDRSADAPQTGENALPKLPQTRQAHIPSFNHAETALDTRVDGGEGYPRHLIWTGVRPTASQPVSRQW